MSYFIYILYSESSNNYHVGHTGDLLEERLRKDNSDQKGFTGRSKDWQLVYNEPFIDKRAAIKREMEIKSWKNRNKIESLMRSAE